MRSSSGKRQMPSTQKTTELARIYTNEVVAVDTISGSGDGSSGSGNGSIVDIDRCYVTLCYVSSSNDYYCTLLYHHLFIVIIIITYYYYYYYYYYY